MFILGDNDEGQMRTRPNMIRIWPVDQYISEPINTFLAGLNWGARTS